MKRSRSSSDFLWPLAGLALLGAAVSRLGRDGRFFAGKVAVITGGSRGLGLALARRLRAEGAHLALFARDAGELARARQDLLAIAPGETPAAEVLTVPCDLTSAPEIQRSIEAVAQHFGALDVLVNVAGIIQAGPLQNMTPADFERTMATNFWGAFHTSWAALPHLRASKGARIVNIASIGGRIAVPHLAPYNASKFALVGLSSSLTVELARENIRVTTVCPGLLRTGSHVHAEFKGQHAEEFDWFSMSNSFPLDSVSAESAVRRIVEACRVGKRFLSFPLSSRVAEIAMAVCPNLTLGALSLVNRWVLPKPGKGLGANDVRTGQESRSMQVTPAWKTGLADEATAANNEG